MSQPDLTAAGIEAGKQFASPFPAHLRTMLPTSPGPLPPEMALELVERFFTMGQNKGLLTSLRVDLQRDKRGMTIRVELPG